MSKLTPIILAAIMLASTSLVALDWAELENKNMIEADGRSGPDAKVTDILSPRATTIDSNTGEKTNTLDSGESVEFEVYIENIGDVDIEEMAVSLTIYLSEGGQRGMVAKDAAGNDLSWTNGDVVCDDSFVCPWSTLASSSTLNNGRYTITYQGSPVVWTPITGDYVIVVSVDALDDADPGNDEYERFVAVTDWTDVIVDLEWASGNDVEQGTDQKEFILSVETGGSTNWSARNVTLELEIIGEVSAATSVSGDDILGTTILTDLGTMTTVETFRHAEDESNFTNGSRYVIEFQDSTEWRGYVTPDTASNGGMYSVSVNLISYVLYDQLPECEETETINPNSTDPNATTEERTFIHWCEVEQTQDANAATSEAEIEGSVLTYHDIGVVDLVINQGYAEVVDGMPTTDPTMPDVREGPLNPAWSSIQASVRHLGTDTQVHYDWKVDFEIENVVSGVTETFTANNCTFGAGDDYEHMMLGEDFSGTIPPAAAPLGSACIFYYFAPGVYNIHAEITMLNVDQTDASARNDDMSIFEISALNNRPSVALTIQEDPLSVVMSPDSTITLEADAFDADDETGATLNYVWTHPAMMEINGTVQPSPCNGQGQEFSTCVLTPDEAAWAGTHVYSVTVSDQFGSSAMDFTDFFVWNHVIASDTTDSGIMMDYNLTYRGANEFTIELDDKDVVYTRDMGDFDYPGQFSSEAVLKYKPSTTYLASDVHDQDIMITYDTDSITPTGAFWVSTNGQWAELSSTFTESGSTGMIAIDLGDGSQVLQQGEIVLMGGELQEIELPTARVKDLTVLAQRGGTITASWAIDGNTGPSDYLKIEICNSQDTDCDTITENKSTIGLSLDGQTETVHGVTYTIEIYLCNVAGCDPSQKAGPESATADNKVDGPVTATNMGVSNKAGSDAWTVTWDVDGDASDVAGWMVCYNLGGWSVAGDMPSTCEDAGAANTVDIAHGGASGTYHFTAVAYDDKGNMDTALAGTDILLQVADAEGCEDSDYAAANPDLCDQGTVGDADSAESGEVPTWTWGVIIGLVVVSFVAGAFILSRGGGGEGGEDWDY